MDGSPHLQTWKKVFILYYGWQPCVVFNQHVDKLSFEG